MRIAVIGGGPGGLYFGYLWKKRHPGAHVELFEQNPADATWGFGVVFSDQALEFLRADDPETVVAIAPRMESWKTSRSICVAKPSRSMASDFPRSAGSSCSTCCRRARLPPVSRCAMIR